MTETETDRDREREREYRQTERGTAKERKRVLYGLGVNNSVGYRPRVQT